MRYRADCLWHYGVWVAVRPTPKKTPERAARGPRLRDGNTTLPQRADAGQRTLAAAVGTRWFRRKPMSLAKPLEWIVSVRLITLIVVGVVCLTTAAEAPEPPLADARLSVHTLVREDIFAGVLDGDLDRLARGERNIETLLERRPAEKPGLIAWKASATLYRAVRAHESGRTEEFQVKYAQVVDLLAEAKKL